MPRRYDLSEIISFVPILALSFEQPHRYGVGLRRARSLGAQAALVGFTLPSTIVLMVFVFGLANCASSGSAA